MTLHIKIPFTDPFTALIHVQCCINNFHLHLYWFKPREATLVTLVLAIGTLGSCLPFDTILAFNIIMETTWIE